MPASKRGDPAWLLAIPAIRCPWHAKKCGLHAKSTAAEGGHGGDEAGRTDPPRRRRSCGWCCTTGITLPKSHRLRYDVGSRVGTNSPPTSQLSRCSFQLHVTSGRDGWGGAGRGPFPPPLHLPTSQLVPARSHLNLWDTQLCHHHHPGWLASPSRGMAGGVGGTPGALGDVAVGGAGAASPMIGVGWGGTRMPQLRRGRGYLKDPACPQVSLMTI